jgi:uncharacterized damage-inducible protein DinB
MGMIDSLLQELEMEAQTTRSVLDRVPEDKLSWRPHPKSYSAGQLALHIASAIGQVSHMVTMDSMEMPSFQQPEAASRQEILNALDASLKIARETLTGLNDAKLMAKLSIRKDGVAMMEIPKIGLIRNLLLNHQYHHRGQLTVYLRLLSVPVPSVYGPSADEAMM